MKENQEGHSPKEYSMENTFSHIHTTDLVMLAAVLKRTSDDRTLRLSDVVLDLNDLGGEFSGLTLEGFYYDELSNVVFSGVFDFDGHALRDDLWIHEQVTNPATSVLTYTISKEVFDVRGQIIAAANTRLAQS